MSFLSPIKRKMSTAASAASKCGGNNKAWRAFESEMWRMYQRVAPQANRIHSLFNEQGEDIRNDHVAFRTFNHERVGMNVFEQNLLQHYNYKPVHCYNITEKNLFAKHFEHAEFPTESPLIFVSEFDIGTLSHENQDTVQEMMESIDATYAPVKDDKFLIKGRVWDPIAVAQYEALQSQSSYAAWVAAFGFLPNHFTVSVNYLHKYSTLKQVNRFIETHGFTLNESGGKIKGSADIGLMQSSTMAPLVEMQFKDGSTFIPGAYYEFAHRFVVEHDNVSELFRGFVGDHANKIFESTNRPN